MNILEVRNLNKTYKDFQLKDVNLTIPKGYIMGFVGQNGAGKTSIINLINHICKCDSGSIKIDGISYADDPVRYKESIAYVGDECYFTKGLKVKNVKQTLKEFYPTFDSEKFDSLIEKYNLPINKNIINFSRGMKVKLMFATVFSRDAKLLILDEATNGLDPVVREELMGELQKYIVHFTVSPEHRALFKALVDEKAAAYAKKYGVDYNITFSEQKPSTDTIAADMENKPFRDNGKLLFRPGGHGALIENLNDLDADIIFIKNIDNVVPDKLKGDTVLYKKLIAGVLVALQQKVFAYLQLLESGKYTHEQILEILQFLQKQLYCKNPETKNLEDAELVIYLKEKLNRPMRVCGMVKNVGEPGGGPFLAYNSDGTISLQILESSQIDMDDPEKKEMFEKGTHFNPVDLVCAVRDYKGHKFNLVKYVDKATGFISYKSKNGKDLKALELPGLWNGAMSDWNTVFVEVPLTTFNPVKTVNDLLREQHQ